MTRTGLSGRRVLVVEDEILVLMCIEQMLADLGCEVVGPATTIDAALRLIASTEIDCAVLDMNLHGSETYPIADALADRGLPFIFATGYGAEDISPSYGQVPVLQKPFETPDLARVLSNALLANAAPRKT